MFAAVAIKRRVPASYAARLAEREVEAKSRGAARSNRSAGEAARVSTDAL